MSVLVVGGCIVATRRITVAPERAGRGSTRDEPCWIAHRPRCRTVHRTSVHPASSIQGVGLDSSLSRCAGVQTPWWNHAMRWRRTWGDRRSLGIDVLQSRNVQSVTAQHSQCVVCLCAGRRHRPISAYNVSTVRASETKFNYREWEVDHALSNQI